MSKDLNHFPMQGVSLPDFVGYTFYVTLQNDRILKGSLMALDAQLNLLLDHVQEHADGNRRTLGLVSVPKKTIRSIKISKSELHELVESKQKLLRNIV